MSSKLPAAGGSGSAGPDLVAAPNPATSRRSAALRRRQRAADRRWENRPEPPGASVELGVGVGPLAGAALACLPPEGLSPQGLLEALAACEAQMSWLASVRARLLAEMMRRDPSAADDQWCREELALACDLDNGEARRRLLTAQALAERLPATGGSLAAGRCSWEFAVAMAEATEGLDPARSAAVEEKVFADEQVRTPRQARRIARARALEADPVLAERAGRGTRAGRHLQMWPNSDGTHGGWMVLPDEEARLVAGVLDRLAVRQGPDDLRPVGARRADALVELCSWWGDGPGRCPHCSGGLPDPTVGTPGGSAPAPASGSGPEGPAWTGRPRPAAVTVTVDLPTLLGVTDRPGMVDGQFPVLAETARRLACDANLSRLVTDPLTGGVIDLGRAVRFPTLAQRRRLEMRDGGCRFPTCTRPAARCHAHHLRHWEDGGPTDEANLLLLCHRHHQAVHEGGWRVRLDVERNAVSWLPPERSDIFEELRAPGDDTEDRAPDPPLYQPWVPPPPRPCRGRKPPSPSALLPDPYPEEPPF